MTSANASLLGFAKQTAKGTPNTTDNAFKYVLFTNGAVAPNNVTIPLDPEVGGGAMLRDMKKVGVFSGGGMELIPRPDTLGLFLLGAFGKVVTVTQGSTAFKHTFTLDTDQFAAPYMTVRSAPGNLWGEQLQDVRVNALGLEFRGANFVRGTVGLMGGLPTKVSTATWAAANKVDGGPQFIAPVSKIELPTGTNAKVLAGGFSAGMAIPLDQQWIVGSYSPDAMDIVQRVFAVNFLLKIDDATLYTKMSYDPAAGSAWTANLFREANFKLELVSDIIADGSTPYSLAIKGNGNSGATANVVWSAQPVGSRAGQQITMAVTGVYLASDTTPITAELINKTASY
jgi:hypothetical protein